MSQTQVDFLGQHQVPSTCRTASNSNLLEWQCGGVLPSARAAATLRAKCFLATSFLLNFSPTGSAHYLACRDCGSQFVFLDRPPKLQAAQDKSPATARCSTVIVAHLLFAWVRHLAAQTVSVQKKARLAVF